MPDQIYARGVTYPPPISANMVTPANPPIKTMCGRTPTVKGLDRVAALRALDGWGILPHSLN